MHLAVPPALLKFADAVAKPVHIEQGARVRAPANQKVGHLCQSGTLAKQHSHFCSAREAHGQQT